MHSGLHRLAQVVGVGILFFIMGASQANSTTRAQLSSAVAQGASWLQSQIQVDGSLSAEVQSVATPLQARAEAYIALHALGIGTGALSIGVGTLDATGNTEFLARQIIVAVQSGGSAVTLLATLATNQNSDGGFGDLGGYQSTAFDTTYALLALNAAGQGDSTAAHNAVQYLLSRQASDGSWSDWPGTDIAYSTAVAMQALIPYRTQLTATGAALQSAATWLASTRQSGSDWKASFINAQVLIALAGTNADSALVTSAAGDLGNAQYNDGSWGDDDFTTALAVRALQAVQNLASPTQPVGLAQGYVVEADTGRPIFGATVFVASNSQYTVTTNADGYYLLSNVPAGQVTLVASASGYDAASVVTRIVVGSSTDVSHIVLGQDSTSSLVYGRITDQDSGAPLAGASIQLDGPAKYSITAASDGGFALGAVTPGQYTFTISASGYITDTGTVSYAAGSRNQIDQALLSNGTYAGSSPIDVSAMIVDANSSEPIANATLILNSSLRGSSDANGSVNISGVPAGTYQASVSAAGHATGLYTVIFSPGSNGNLGTLRLYPSGDNVAPSTLTLMGHVASGLGGQPIADATITRTDTGDNWTSGADGSFTISGVKVLSFPLQIAASGYTTQKFTVTASGFGTIAHTFALPASGGSSSATTVQLSGTVTDATTGAAISNVTIALSGGGAQVETDSSGNYQLSKISSLGFMLQVSAVGYVTQSIPVTVSQFGNYKLNIKLSMASSPSALQILSVGAKVSPSPSRIGVFIATVGNTSSSDVTTTLFAEVTDAKGDVVASLGGRISGTSNSPSTFTVPASSQISVEFDWVPKQSPAGSYVLTVYAITPGTETQSNLHGMVLATGDTWVTVNPTQALGGQLVFNPPLVQAGTQNPVAISALIVNVGNVVLPAQTLQLTITDPASGNTVYTATAQLASLAVNHNVTIDFGSWLPTATGNLKAHIASANTDVAGGIDGTLYVGNKATGEFTVDRTIVPPGDNTVNAKVDMQGVDVTQGISTDPLFYAVRRAVTNGAAYVEPNAEQWQNQHHCLGCHIQSQSLTGLSSSIDKVPIDMKAVKFLATALATSQKSDSDYRLAYPQYSLTQTILNFWALNQYPDEGILFGNRLKAAMYLHQRRSVSGGKIYWYPDYWHGWWASQDRLTALAVKGLADVLQAAPAVDTSKVATYAWSKLSAAGVVTTGRGLKVGSDGRVYALQQNGMIDWADPAAGTHGTIPVTGLPGSAYGLAIATDGSFYISGTGFVAHVVPGQTPTFIWKGSGQVSDVVLSPAGKLYGVNTDTSQLLCFCGATPTVVLDNKTLNQPGGLAFGPSGNLMIADSGNYDLIQIALDGTVTPWAQGLGQQPERITSDGQGGWYVRSAAGDPLGYYDPPELYRFTPDGVGQRIAGASNLSGIALFSGKPVANNLQLNTAVELGSRPVDVASDLVSLRQDVTGAAHYFLGTYQDGNTSIITQALRLWGMAEARKVVANPTLKNQLDQAVAYLDAKLRSGQHADGGWGRQPGSASDALVTAIVGLALDYSHPSPQDKVTRSAIQFLLNTQQGDGSWLSADGIMQTHLSTTSLVMDYMPDALSFLGGLDVDLYVADTPKSSFTNIQPAQDDTSIDSKGISTYHWHLAGVTSSSREVDFDVNLSNLLANENRPVASAAYLEFKNSFNKSTIKVDLAIPHVRAASGLGITVGTDLSQYGADVPVKINGSVGNSGVPTTNAQVDVQISAPDGTLLTTLHPASGLQIATGGQSVYATTWNAGEYAPGTYGVKASIIDSTGTVADTAETTFHIVASGGNGGEEASLRTSTDKPTYNATDTVNIADLVQNVTANADLSLVHLHVMVTGPDGQTVQTFDHNLGQLAPGAQRNVPETLVLDHAAQGQYTVAAQVTDATGAVQATAQAAFTVSDQLAHSLTGRVIVESPHLYQGQTEICTDILTNDGTQMLSSQPIEQLLVSIADGSALATTDSNVDLTPGQQTRLIRNIDTTHLAVGDYACVLQAKKKGAWKPLGYASFHVAPPPIKLVISQSEQVANRVLVLISCHEDRDDRDMRAKNGHHEGNHGHDTKCKIRRSETIDTLLTGLHVAHHVSVTVGNFVRELRSGEYNQYWVLGGLSDRRNHLSEELEEAVFRGNTLLVDGERHGWKNAELFAMAGVRVHGKHPASENSTVSIEAPFFTPAVLGISGRVLRFKATVGTVDAEFNHSCDDRDHDEDRYRHCRRRWSPAIVSAAYGKGRAIALGFDLAGTLKAIGGNGWSTPMGKVIQYLLPVPTATILPHAYLPVTTHVQNQGIAVTLDVADLLPTGTTYVDATPEPTSVTQGEVAWQAPLAVDQSPNFTADFSVPAQPGNYRLTSNVATITNGSTAPYGSVSYPFSVSDPQVLSQRVAAEIGALAVHGYDRRRRNDALHELGEGENDAVRRRYGGAIHELLEAAEDLEHIDDTGVTVVRADLDTLIAACELDWYWSWEGNAPHKKHGGHFGPPYRH